MIRLLQACREANVLALRGAAVTVVIRQGCGGMCHPLLIQNVTLREQTLVFCFLNFTIYGSSLVLKQI